MAIIKEKSIESFFDDNSTSLIIPVPARVRNKNFKNNFLPITEEAFDKYNIAHERYKEISQQKTSFDNGEVYVLRDVDFKGVDIQNPEVNVDDVISRIESDSKLIVLLPIKTREDKDMQEHVYMSSLRALSNLIKQDEEVLEQFKVLYLPNFDDLNLEKVKEIFAEVDIEIFVCFDSN